MKKTLFSLLLLSAFTQVYGQDYTMTVGNIVTEIKFYSPEIVRVTKYQKSDELGKADPKVVVTMTPQTVNPKTLHGTNVDTLQTERMMVICNRVSGLLNFIRPDGTTLIRERSKATFTKRTSHTIDPYTVSQTFRLTNGEAIYGLGQVQDGALNHRNKSYNHMVQNNTTVWIPFFHSTRGYGL